MDPTTHLPHSSAPESCISTQPPLPPPPPPPAAIISPSQPPLLLEISLISAQDLAPIHKSMQTYAVAWIDAARKHTTRTDQRGNKNPTWDDKFTLPMDGSEDTAVLTIEIYTVSWFRDVLVGLVKAPLADLINPLARAGCTRFVALQVLRSTGNPQGILNMGVALLESNTSAAPPPQQDKPEIQIDEDDDDNKKELNEKINLWRSMSMGSSQVTNNEEFPVKLGSVCNASEICSDIGPSASIVAMEIAMKHLPGNPRQADQHRGDGGSSILEELTMEDARAKGYGQAGSRWRKVAAQYDHHRLGDEDGDESELLWDGKGRRRHPRRSTSDGSLFSCLVFGIEFTIVCGGGGSKSGRGGNKSSYSSSSRRRILNNTDHSTISG